MYIQHIYSYICIIIYKYCGFLRHLPRIISGECKDGHLAWHWESHSIRIFALFRIIAEFYLTYLGLYLENVHCTNGSWAWYWVPYSRFIFVLFLYILQIFTPLTLDYFWRMYRWVLGAVQHIFVLFLYILRIFTALTSDYFWRMHRWVMGLVLGTVQHVLPNFQLIILERN